VSDVIALAARAAEKLEYTTDSLEDLADKDPEIEAVRDDARFLQALDSMIFCCVTCNWWKRQRENATPDAAEWECQECFNEDHPSRQ
jgi:hypothetical protein